MTPAIMDLSRRRLEQVEAQWNAIGQLDEGQISFLIGLAKAFIEGTTRDSDEIRLLRKTPEPFANAANFYEVESQTDEDTQLLVRRGTGFASALTVRDFRAAQRVIRGQNEAGLKERGGGQS